MSIKLTRSLEDRYSKLCFPEKVDLTQSNGFPDFLEPNELEVAKISDHLKFGKRGYLVCAGGPERPFLNLMFSPQRLCAGVIVCDTNPKVYAYGNFNLLVIRLSEAQEEYEALSRTTKTDEEFVQRIQIISDKVEKSHLPENLKKFWDPTRINDFGAIYLKAEKLWRDSKYFFHECKYHKNVIQFNKLKGYADAGNIIFIPNSDINNLTFLKGKTISIIDVSNIPHYRFLNFQGIGKFCPRVIWTDITINKQFCYQSYVYQPFTPRQHERFDTSLNVIKGCTFPEKQYPHGDEYALWLIREQRLQKKDPFNADLGPFRTQKTLDFLDWYCSTYLVSLPKGIVNMHTEDIRALNAYSVEEIEEDSMVEWEELQPFTKELVQAWKCLDPHVYFAFSQMKGWKESFERYFLTHPSEFGEFLDRMRGDSSFEKFTLEASLESLKKTNV